MVSLQGGRRAGAQLALPFSCDDSLVCGPNAEMWFQVQDVVGREGYGCAIMAVPGGWLECNSASTATWWGWWPAVGCELLWNGGRGIGPEYEGFACCK